MIIEIAILVVFGYLLRLIMSISFSNAVYTDDRSAHAYLIKCAQNHRGLNFTLEGALIDTYFGYPKLQHYIISRFPERKWQAIGNYLVIAYDLIWTVAVYFLSLRFFKMETEFGSLSSAFWVSVLFTTTPVLFPVTSRLVGSGNARSLGALLSFFLYIAFYLAYFQSIEWCFVLVFLLVGLVILSSEFALQSVLFSFIGISGLYLDAFPILILLFSIAIWYALPFGARHVLRHKWNHWKWYRKNISKVGQLTDRNKIADIFRLPYLFFRDRERFFKIIFWDNSYVILAYSVPVIFFLVFAFIKERYVIFQMLDRGYMYYCFVLIASSALAFVLTSFRAFLYLGQAERYFEYCAPFVALLAVFLIERLHFPQTMLTLILLCNISGILFILFYKARTFYSNHLGEIPLSPEVIGVVDHLKENYNQARVLVVPIKLSRFLGYLLFNERSTIKFYHRFMSDKNGYRDFQEDTESDFELPVPDLDHFIGKYNIDTVVFQKGYLRDKEYFQKWDWTRLELRFENEKYLAYSIKKQ